MYISLSLRKIEESRQINNEKEKTERDVSSYLNFFSELSLYASVTFIFKEVILLKISFLIVHAEKKVKITFNSWTSSHPYPHYIFTWRFLKLFCIKYTLFSLSVRGV